MAGETCNHIRVQIISRSSGGNALAAAAYRSGTKLKDQENEQTFDYSRKTGVFGSEIFVPVHLQDVEWANDREQLWNMVEAKESESKRAASARLAREVMIPLPNELSNEQKQELVRTYVNEQFVSAGMIADVSYHNFDITNSHAHIMLTMREANEDGFGKKVREWDKTEQLNLWREQWTTTANRLGKEWEMELNLDHRSYAERGIEQIPEVHLGAAHAMEQRGIQTELGDQNRLIQSLNKQMKLERELEQDLGYEVHLPPPDIENQQWQEERQQIEVILVADIMEQKQEQTFQQEQNEKELTEEQILSNENHEQLEQTQAQNQDWFDRYFEYLQTQEERNITEAVNEFQEERQMTQQERKDAGLASIFQQESNEAATTNEMEDGAEMEDDFEMDDDYGMEMGMS